MSNIVKTVRLICDLDVARVKVEAAAAACRASAAWVDWCTGSEASGEAVRLEMAHFWAVHGAGGVVHELARLAVEDDEVRAAVVGAGLFRIEAMPEVGRWLECLAFPVGHTWALPPEIAFTDLGPEVAAALAAHDDLEDIDDVAAVLVREVHGGDLERARVETNRDDLDAL